MKKTFLFFLITIFSLFLSCAKDFSAAKLEPSKEKNMQTLFITVNGKKISATLEDNSSSRALVEKLKTAGVTYEAHDYGGFEKFGDLP